MLVNLTYGALASRLQEQIKSQNIVLTEKQEIALRSIQADADAITRLVCRGLINSKVAKKARTYLTKQIEQEVLN